jgi:hypothetical protein
MASTPFFYQLLLASLVLLCLSIHVWWPAPRRPAPPLTTAKPAKPRRQRSTEPPPCTGYIHTPLCAACEHGAGTRPKAPGSPPPILTFPRGRKRPVAPIRARISCVTKQISHTTN